MKMKQLREKLSEDGFDVSERMVKYYIEIGLLPDAEHTHANQAQYSPIHLLRLCKICSLKEKGYIFSEIKRVITEDNENIMLYAKKNNITYEDAFKTYEIYAKEEADYFFNYLDSETIELTKEELIRKTSCDKMVFDLAIDTGAMVEKEHYNHTDLLVLSCINNLFKIGENEGKIEIIEKISEVSKINNIAMQYVHLFEKNPDRKWIYEKLMQSIANNKMEQICEKNKNSQETSVL